MTPCCISFETLKTCSLKNISKNKYIKSLACANRNIFSPPLKNNLMIVLVLLLSYFRLILKIVLTFLLSS